MSESMTDDISQGSMIKRADGWHWELKEDKCENAVSVPRRGASSLGPALSLPQRVLEEAE